jgi:hypothetical protein
MKIANVVTELIGNAPLFRLNRLSTALYRHLGA